MNNGSLPAAAATATPACTFNGTTLPLLLNGTAGEKIAIACTGLPPLEPYLFFETSLLLGIDPKAAPLLDGDITSVAGLEALLSALPEVNPEALDFPVANLSGDLDFTYTLPTSQAPDKNATCPPSTAEINMGLIGCALAMIDLTTIKVVAAGSGLVEYTGDPLFPPNPTLAVSTKEAAPGQVVNVSDKPGATTYWWLSTLTTLEATARWHAADTDDQGQSGGEAWVGRRRQHRHGDSGCLQLPGPDPADDLGWVHRAQRGLRAREGDRHVRREPSGVPLDQLSQGEFQGRGVIAEGRSTLSRRISRALGVLRRGPGRSEGDGRVELPLGQPALDLGRLLAGGGQLGSQPVRPPADLLGLAQASLVEPAPVTALEGRR